jgi:glycosyltransferase involved in cell wall biosynthesis
MRIVFDCRSVFPGMGGIGRATAALARALPAALVGHELLLLVGARRSERPLVEAPNVREIPVDAAMIDPEFEQIRLPGLLAEVEADLYHGTCFSVPLARGHTKRVATVHDVVFRRRPDLVDDGLRRYLDRWTDVSCSVADAVVTVSEFSRREIADLYGRAESRIDVVSNAVDREFFSIERRHQGGRPTLLSVGALEAKKNVRALLAGFARLLEREPALPHELVLVGGQGGARFDLDTSLGALGPARERVRILGHVPESQLHELYATSAGFAYLSEYEGFGLPPLEAMAAGVPTLVSNLSCLPEVTGDGALAVNPHDPNAVAVALSRLLKDEELRRTLVKRGRKVAAWYSWEKSATALARVYERLITKPERAQPALKILVGGAR